jgi:Flp pilus assembly protein TadD
MTPGREGHNARLYVVIGTIYSDAGQRDLAASAFDQAIALDPENEKAWSGKCRTEILAAKNPDAAGADCEKAARLDSHDADVLDSSGIAQFRLGHMDAAFEDFNAAIRTSFKRPGSFFLRGVVEHRLGRAAEGDADIQTALSLDPAIGKTVAGYGIAP